MNGRLEHTLRSYLVGDLSEAKRLEIEERLVREPIVFDRFSVIEQDVIDEYLDGTLAADERRRFEGHVKAAGDLRRRLEFTRTLREYARASPAAAAGDNLVPASWFAIMSETGPAWAAAIAVLMIAIGGSAWVTTLITRPVPKPATQVAALAPAASPTFVLTTGRTRSGGLLTRITVPEHVETVRLRLPISDGRFSSYRATLHDADGEELWMQSKLIADAATSHAAAVSLLVPARALVPGDYQLALVGTPRGGPTESVATYAFRVAMPAGSR